jgi:segregation and condensation protein B
MSRRSKPADALDLDLDDLPAPARWRVWMGRVEAAIFAAAAPVSREMLARIVGRAANLEALIADISDELRERPYEIVAVAGGWAFRTKALYAEAIRVAGGARDSADLSKFEALVLTAIAYFQPITRAQIGEFLGREVSRDAIAALRAAGLIAAGPRSPQPGAPYNFVTTPGFLAHFGFESLRDLEDFEQLQDAGLLEHARGADIARALGLDREPEDRETREDRPGAAIAAE